MNPTSTLAPGSWRALPLAFLAVIALFAGLSAVAISRFQTIEAATQEIADNMLESVALVSRMARDISRERLLVELHIFERAATPMHVLEQEIDDARSDYLAAAQAYAPLATVPGEASAWRRLDADIRSLRIPTENVLALSRVNRDVEAYAAARALDADFERISNEADTVIEINRKAAHKQVDETVARERRTTRLISGLSVAGIIAAILIGWRVTRLGRDREERLHRKSMDLVLRNQDLDAFAGRVAHDLRGPITAIRIAASRLGNQAAESGAMTALTRGVGRMESLIEDLLTLSRVDAAPTTESCDPAEEARKVCQELIAQLGRDDSLRLAVAPAVVRCAAGRLQQVLWNLVDNALKYRRAGEPTEIEILGSFTGHDRYRLCVADNGIGMTADDAGRAFDPFFRSEAIRSLPGTGLGLSIVKRLVDVSGGSISLQSEPGRGTTFVITLPLERGEPFPGSPGTPARPGRSPAEAEPPRA